MIIGSNKKLHKIETPDAPKPQFRIGSEGVKLVSDVKYLGVQVEQELKWTNHLTTVTKKISRGIGILRYAKQYLPPATIETMYRSLVEPYFRYCCQVWGNTGVSITGKLQKLQNRAAKLITNSQGAPKAREGKRPVLRIVPMFDANSDRGALIFE